MKSKLSAHYTAPAVSTDEISIRECVTIDDFKQCIALEKAVWGDDDIGIMPVRLYMLSKACNAPTIGAFDSSNRLVGFVHTMLALRDQRAVYHSHLAAVVEELRHRDIGFRMKLAQRECALRSGIRLVIWTFDPLQSRNAHLNINKLGVIAKRYEVNYYGEDVSAVFDPGVPSDRIYAEWWIDSPHVVEVLKGKRPGIGEEMGSVFIPDDIEPIRTGSFQEHMRWRFRVREEFQRHFGQGHVVRGFERDSKTGRSRYILGPDSHEFRFGEKTDRELG